MRSLDAGPPPTIVHQFEYVISTVKELQSYSGHAVMIKQLLDEAERDINIYIKIYQLWLRSGKSWYHAKAELNNCFIIQL